MFNRRAVRWQAARRSRKFTRPGRGQSLASVILGFATLFAVAGCAVTPTAAPPTAQQIFANAAHSRMKDATIDLTGSLNTDASGSTTSVTITGNGQIVLKPALASKLTLIVNLSGSTVTGGVTIDEISIGDTAYTRTQLQIPGLPFTNSNLYTKLSVPVSQASTLIPQTAANLRLVGEDAIRGDKCWHLTGSVAGADQSTPDISSTNNTANVNFDVWIRESDFYYVRVKLNTLPGLNLPLGNSTNSSSSSSSATDVGIVLDLSKYDQGTTIAPPPADQVQS